MGRDSGACAQDRVPSRAVSLPRPFLRGADLAAETDTEQVCSQGQEGAASFSSVRSDQAGLQGEKMVFSLHQSSVHTLPLQSNQAQSRRVWVGRGRQASRTWGGRPLRNGFPSCLLMNTSLWQLNGFLFLLVTPCLLNHGCPGLFEMLKQHLF